MLEVMAVLEKGVPADQKFTDHLSEYHMHFEAAMKKTGWSEGRGARGEGATMITLGDCVRLLGKVLRSYRTRARVEDMMIEDSVVGGGAMMSHDENGAPRRSKEHKCIGFSS